MPTFCPDCSFGLDTVAVGDPCPECGGSRRSVNVEASATLAIAVGVAPAVSVGYTRKPGWAYQWNGIQRHLGRLRDQYAGNSAGGNVEVEDTIHSLFLSLFHLKDWLHEDDSTGLDEGVLKAFIDNNADSVGLCRDYANTWKHKRRNHASARQVQIAQISTGRGGVAVCLEYWRPTDAHSVTRVDALDLAERSEQAWRTFLSSKDLALPA